MAVIFLWRACGAGTEVAQFRLNLSARADRDYASLLACRLKEILAGIHSENEKSDSLSLGNGFINEFRH